MVKTATVGRKKGLLVTPVGLQIGEALEYDAWARAGARIARAHDSSAWCLGDWIVYGKSRYEGRYREAVEASDLDYQTLRKYAWVSRQFPLERRRAGLSLQHRAEVAALPEAEQDRWLDLAERRAWTRSELRRQVRGIRGNGAKVTSLRALRGIDVPPDRSERWTAAAAHSDRSLESWVLWQLDKAAARTLGTELAGESAA
jgi:hypothetical protein